MVHKAWYICVYIFVYIIYVNIKKQTHIDTCVYVYMCAVIFLSSSVRAITTKSHNII